MDFLNTLTVNANQADEIGMSAKDYDRTVHDDADTITMRCSLQEEQKVLSKIFTNSLPLSTRSFFVRSIGCNFKLAGHTTEIMGVFDVLAD